VDDAEAHVLEVEHLRGAEPRVVGAQGAAAAPVVAVAAHAEHGGLAALFEPVQHLDGVQVAGVQDQVEAGEPLVGLVPERASFGVVRVADEADADQVDFPPICVPSPLSRTSKRA